MQLRCNFFLVRGWWVGGGWVGGWAGGWMGGWVDWVVEKLLQE